MSVLGEDGAVSRHYKARTVFKMGPFTGRQCHTLTRPVHKAFVNTEIMVFIRRSFARQYAVCSPAIDDKKKVSLFMFVFLSLYLENLQEYLKIVSSDSLTDQIDLTVCS